MKKLHYGFIILAVGLVLGKYYVNALPPSPKMIQQQQVERFIQRMQEAVDNNDKEEAREILAEAEQTLPTLNYIKQKDKNNTLKLLVESMQFFDMPAEVAS